jgi:hypothetical protein
MNEMTAISIGAATGVGRILARAVEISGGGIS